MTKLRIMPTDEFIEKNKTPHHRGIEKPEINHSNLQPTERVKIMTELPNVFGVENFVKLIKAAGKVFDGVYEAKLDDSEISLTEGVTLIVSLAPDAIGLISGITQIPQEVIYDRLSDDDITQIQLAFDNIKNLKGDTRDATKEFLALILGLKDWYFKYFVNPPVE